MPLVIFKKEKEISRSLEFDGMWIAEQPPDDDFLAHWDKIVISTRSFPDKYWDKFVKKKVRPSQYSRVVSCAHVVCFVQVRARYSEQYEFEQISTLLGMDKMEGVQVKAKSDSILPALSVQ